MRSLLQRWRALRHGERIAAIVVAAVLCGAVALAAFLERDTRVPLFATPLRGEQVAEVVERLAQWNDAFIVTADNVRVDAGKRNALLLRLALVGVPHQHLESSADALAKAGPLTPQSVLDAQRVEGLAGDLAAGLRKLAGVQDAQVIIAPASDGAFADEAAHAATASVRLSLAPGAGLGASALDGVRNFVASAVPGLDAKRVAILDDRGSSLGGDSTNVPDEAQGMQQSLQSALDVALGAGATVVRVRVNYDQRTHELHDVVRKPVGSRAIGTTSVDEHYKSSSKQYVKTTGSTDRGSIVEDDRVETPAGRVERISVAVAVDAARRLDVEKIRSLSKATLGLVSSRGDVVSVEEVTFPHEPIAAHDARLSTVLGFAEALAPATLFALALVAMTWLGAKPLGRACEAIVSRASLRRAASAVVAFAPAQVRGALANEPPHTAAAIISALPAATATAVLEMYSPEERAAIVRRMSRPAAPVIPDYQTIARHG